MSVVQWNFLNTGVYVHFDITFDQDTSIYTYILISHILKYFSITDKVNKSMLIAVISECTH